MIKELRVGNYVAYKGKPSLVCALDYDPKLRKENISVVYKWGEPPYKTNGDIQPILLTEKLVLQCGFNQLDDYTFDNDEMEKAILSQKLDNLFGILDMDLCIDDNMNTTFDSDLFSFD